jgi:predicted nucleic acid-binding protein
MIVVADTSPINYLVLIEEIDVLTKMYGTVVIPRMVCEELLRPSGPETVRAWISQPPNWLEVRAPLTHQMSPWLGLMRESETQSYLQENFTPTN